MNQALAEILQRFKQEKESTAEWASGMGLAISVIRGGELLLQECFGYRDQAGKLPVTEDTIFEVGSLAKSFTASAFLMAQEEGKLDIGVPINKRSQVLSLLDADASKDLAIVDLLSHRTGIPSNDCLWYFGSTQTEQVRKSIAQLEPIPNGFRNAFIYSNLQYGALGGLFPHFVGESWSSYIQRKMLEPLGLGHTFIGSEPVGNEPDLAVPYSGSQVLPRKNMEAVAAAGGVRSSIGDMTEWMGFHLRGGKTKAGKQYLSETSINLMQQPHIAISDRAQLYFQGFEWLLQSPSYGLGWFVGEVAGKKVVYHMGLIDGFTASIVMLPELKIGIAVLTNNNFSPIPGTLSRRLVSALLHDDAIDSQPSKAAAASVEERADPKPVFELPVAEGVYENAAYGRIEIRLEEGANVLYYFDSVWPLRFESATQAGFVINAFGLQIPLPAVFQIENGKTRSLSIPFAFHPGVGAILFNRI